MNVLESIESTAKRQPERPAILFEGNVISYAQLLDRVSELSSVVANHVALSQGDRVAILLPNVPEFCVAYLSALGRGLVAVSVGAMLKEQEVVDILYDSGARVLFTNEELCPNAGPLQRRIEGVTVVRLHGEQIQIAGPGQNALTGDRSSPSLVNLPVNAPAAILYTSGTTGKQKGAVLTHTNLIFNSDATARCTGSAPSDRHMLFLPLFHCFGQNFIMNTTLRSGGALVMMRRFELTAVLNQTLEAEATHFYAVPAAYIQLLERSDAERYLGSVRYFFSAAATMPVDVATRFRERFGKPIYEGYGLTETSPLASYNHENDYRPGSIGVPINGVVMKVVDENAQECAPGRWGEICIKGPNVMAGYYERGADTALAIQDGWFHSGDIGYRDESGYYYLVDRLKDMINRAGFKVWPREVEEILYQHPAVKECAVVGAAHPVNGESVIAYVTLHRGSDVSSDDLRAHCQSQLANYKVPERFQFDIAIPKSPAGKILKRELRRHASEGNHDC